MRLKLIQIIILILISNVCLKAQKLIHSEILGKPTDNSIFVQAFFDSDVEACIQYDKNSGLFGSQTAWQTFYNGNSVGININNLEPNTKYYYRLCYRSPGTNVLNTRPEYYFTTQRKTGNTFTFVIQADPHMDEQTDTSLYRLCLKNQLEDSPDFMIDLGDFLMSDKLKNTANQLTHDTIISRCHLLRSYYETGCHSVPLYIALGNHEGEAGWNLNGTKENVAIWDATERMKYFPNPLPNNFYTGDTLNNQFVGQRGNYYSWVWGDALFIVLDPYWYTKPKPDSLNGWRWTLGKVQYDWLKKTLETSSSKFKFVFSHQIVGGDPEGRGGVEVADRYEWGGENIDGTRGFEKNRPGWYKPIRDLLEENKVNIFFHGHDHFFGKQDKNCLIYQETPQPSLPNFQNANQAKDYGYFEGQILPNAGHIRVIVSPEGIKVDYVRAYLPKNETGSRHNKDISASYYIGIKNCYDSVSSDIPIVWNSNYSDEIVYPNPFKTSTKIEFNVNQEEEINIAIFDINGKLIRNLLSINKIQTGKNEVYWDGKDNFGMEQEPGNYIYQIKANKAGVKTGKILLIK